MAVGFFLFSFFFFVLSSELRSTPKKVLIILIEALNTTKIEKIQVCMSFLVLGFSEKVLLSQLLPPLSRDGTTDSPRAKSPAVPGAAG